jgi:hypothetical protein
MTTNNAVNTSLSGQTGTGNFVGNNSPSIITPNTIGVINGGNAPAGSIGELISSVIPNASAVSAPANTIINITSIALTAGSWLVFGNAFLAGGASATAFSAWSSASSVTLPDNSLRNYISGSGVASGLGIQIPQLVYNISAPTIIYLGNVITSSTGNTVGGGIYGLRIR